MSESRQTAVGDPHVFAFVATPVPLAAALVALARQADLGVPAKLALLSDDQPGWLVEVSRRSRDVELVGRRSLAAAHGWLAEVTGERSPDHPPTDPVAACGGDAAVGQARSSLPPVEDLLAAVGASFTPLRAVPPRAALGAPAAPAHASYRLTARHGQPDSTGLGVEMLACGGLCARLAPMWLRLERGSTASTASLRALQLYALAANARLRLTRLGVASPAADVVRIDRDIVVPPEAVSERALAEALDALPVAHSLTAPALRALTRSHLARIFLHMHGAHDDT